MFNFSANHLFFISRTEYASCAVLLMLARVPPYQQSGGASLQPDWCRHPVPGIGGVKSGWGSRTTVSMPVKRPGGDSFQALNAPGPCKLGRPPRFPFEV